MMAVNHLAVSDFLLMPIWGVETLCDRISGWRSVFEKFGSRFDLDSLSAGLETKRET